MRRLRRTCFAISILAGAASLYACSSADDPLHPKSDSTGRATDFEPSAGRDQPSVSALTPRRIRPHAFVNAGGAAGEPDAGQPDSAGIPDTGAAGSGGGTAQQPETPSGYLLLTQENLARVHDKVSSQSPDWIELKSNVDSSMASQDPYLSSAENIALAYLLAKNPAYATAAYSWAQHIMTTENVRADSYLHFGDLMRAVALTLNYCADALSDSQRTEMASYLDQWTDELWFHNQGSGWGLSDAGNNYHMAFLEGTAFAGYALRQAGHANGQKYVDLLKNKLDKQGGVMEYVNTRGRGGDWEEGVNYGQRAKQRLFGALAAIASMDGVNRFNQSPFFAESILYGVHQILPKDLYISPEGDMPRDVKMPLCGFDREYMQTATYWVHDPQARAVGQGWLHSILPSYDIGPFHDRPSYFREVIFGEDGPQIDRSTLPAFYYSQGTRWISSRSGWDPSATHLIISGTPDIEQTHAHFDVGSFVIWKEDYQAVDAASFSQDGLNWEASAHNMVTVPGHERRGGPIGGTRHVSDSPEYTYAQIDSSGLFRRMESGQTNTLLQEYTRELMYLKPDTLVVYDRVAPKAGHENYTWRLHFASQPQVNGNLFSASYHGAGISLMKLIGGPAQVMADSDLESGASSAWRVQELPESPSTGRFLNVVAVASGGAPALSAKLVQSDGAMQGAQVGAQVVLFSGNPLGAPAALPFSYSVECIGPQVHLLANMAESYSVTVSASGTTRKVTVAPGNQVAASADGVLRIEM